MLGRAADRNWSCHGGFYREYPKMLVSSVQHCNPQGFKMNDIYRCPSISGNLKVDSKRRSRACRAFPAQEFGGPLSYLDSIGFCQDDLQRLRALQGLAVWRKHDCLLISDCLICLYMFN